MIKLEKRFQIKKLTKAKKKKRKKNEHQIWKEKKLRGEIEKENKFKNYLK
jgi:hypothetical protein